MIHLNTDYLIAAQRWEDVEVKDLEAGEICVLLGRNPKQTVWHLILSPECESLD